MNDEDFVRAAFRHAMESGFAGEPTGLPSLDDITGRAQRAIRTKQGVYAASAVALAGVVTAGVVAGPSVLGLGGGSPQVGTAGSGSDTTAGATASTGGKARVATACPTPPRIDWAAIISQNVPGATATAVPKATAPDANTCYLLPGGAMNIEVLFDVSNPKGVVEIDVNTGGSKAGTESASASPTPNASDLASMRALKSQLASEQSTSGTPDAADLAKKEALKSELATEQPAGAATNSPPNAVKSPEPDPTCSGTKETQVVCASEVQKGGYVGISVSLSRGTPKPLFVQVIGSTSSPAAVGQHAPLSSAQLTAIAEAVAAHF